MQSQEFNLKDTFSRQRLLTLGALVLSLVISLSLTLMYKQPSVFKTAIEIGSVTLPLKEGEYSKKRLLTAPESVKIKLEMHLLTEALLYYKNIHPNLPTPNIEVAAPPNSNIITISIISAEEKSTLISILQYLVDAILSHHDEVLLASIEDLRIHARETQEKIQGLSFKYENELNLIAEVKSRLKSLDEREKLLSKQLFRVENEIRVAEQYLSNLDISPEKPELTLSRILIEDKVRASKLHRDKLETELSIGLLQTRQENKTKLKYHVNSAQLAKSELNNAEQLFEEYGGIAVLTREDTIEKVKNNEIRTLNASKVIFAPGITLETTGAPKIIVLSFAFITFFIVFVIGILIFDFSQQRIK